jgi:mono/diheme cytochrome c family protein
MGARLCGVGPALKFVALSLLLLALTGCGEMYHQAAFQAQQGPRLAPPTNAVPVGGVEPSYEGVQGQNLADPFPKDAAAVARGKSIFEANCAMCHGHQGKGDGPVGAAFTPKPADVTSTAVQSLSDGDVFLLVTNGVRAMPTFRKLLTPEERWSVVAYVRSLAQAH